MKKTSSIHVFTLFCRYVAVELYTAIRTEVFLAVVLFFLSLGTHTHAQEKKYRLQPCVARVLGEFAFVPAEFRVVTNENFSDARVYQNFWKLYKNNPQFAAWVESKPFLSPHDLIEQFQKNLPTPEELGKLKKQQKRIFDLDQHKITFSEQNSTVDFKIFSKKYTFDDDLHLPQYFTDLPDDYATLTGKIAKGDLTDYEKWLLKIQPEMLLYRSLITDHEKMMLFVRSGDEIVISGQTFSLGKYIGAGNANHIFELTEEPTKVIRINFMAPSPAVTSEYKQEIKKGVENLKENIKGTRVLEKSAQKIQNEYNHLYPASINPQQLNVVKIFESGKNYSIAEKLNPEHDGLQFIKTLMSQKTLTLTEQAKLDALNHQMRALRNEIFPAHHRLSSSESAVHLSKYARQFVWDKDKKKWILADWELADFLPKNFKTNQPWEPQLENWHLKDWLKQKYPEKFTPAPKAVEQEVR